MRYKPGAQIGLPPSARYDELGDDAIVLWHGTSRMRAEKIAEHGLFHKRGLWTAKHPRLPHAFCRMRSERYSTEGAVVCLVVDRSAYTEGSDYEVEHDKNVLRFHHGLPSEVVQYVLTREEIRFTGERRARHPSPWFIGRFKRQSGRWIPTQQAPVRYSDNNVYSTPREFASLCLERLLDERGEICAIEAFSTINETSRPREVFRQRDILTLIGKRCATSRHRAGARVLCAAQPARAI